ncbi:MAG: hypothetical protein SV186_07055 [Candidatus Nanohaloarchaea archaeon]|nr:hypothetical protein [Candidatus Nanohaloarchaea archaeon]
MTELEPELYAADPGATEFSESTGVQQRAYMERSDRIDAAFDRGEERMEDEDWPYQELVTDLFSGYYLATSAAIFLVGGGALADGVATGDYSRAAMGGFLTAAGAKFLLNGRDAASDLYDRLRD